MRTVLYMFVPGFQQQIFRYVSKSKWIPLTKFQWFLLTNTCNVKIVGTFVWLRIPQQANIASCSGFRNCKWISQKDCEEQQQRMALSDNASINFPRHYLIFSKQHCGWDDCRLFWTWDARLAWRSSVRRRRRRLAEKEFDTFVI